MLTIDSGQLIVWLNTFFWPALRILALISSAPFLSERSIPNRVKLALGLTVTFLVAPQINVPYVPIVSIIGLWLGVQQILIGVAIGVTMQLAFAAIRMAGEIIGLQMGISFATFFDPNNRTNEPVIAEFLNLLTMLLFLSFNGHLWMISLVVDSFHTLPLRTGELFSAGFMTVASTASLLFSYGLMFSLPLVTVLLAINMVLGLLNRITPQLSVFAIGFPITLSVGLLTFALSMPLLAPFCERLFAVFFNQLPILLEKMAG
jgi:flagellar biosynthetic protein FliR